MTCEPATRILRPVVCAVRAGRSPRRLSDSARHARRMAFGTARCPPARTQRCTPPHHPSHGQQQRAGYRSVREAHTIVANQARARGKGMRVRLLLCVVCVRWQDSSVSVTAASRPTTPARLWRVRARRRFRVAATTQRLCPRAPCPVFFAHAAAHGATLCHYLLASPRMDT